MIKNKCETIYIKFEGYNFEIIVYYHTNISGVFLVKTKLTNKVKENVNKQEFYHMLHVLKYKIAKREFDKVIKEKLIRKLNSVKQQKHYFCSTILGILFWK